MPSFRTNMKCHNDCELQVDMVLKLWKDGFSVGDGPLRDFKDPENKEFLDAISKG